jgi:DNA-binding LytR/AlgR family response regulator
MNQPQDQSFTDTGRRSRPPSIIALWAAGSALLWGLYTGVFIETIGEGFAEAAVQSIGNVFPITGLAVAVRALLKAEVMRRATPVQILWHAVLAFAFAYTWYAMLIVLLAVFNAPLSRGFVIRGFTGPALAWQIFQGLILYAAIAAVCYAVQGGREAAQVTLVTEPVAPPLTRYLIRKGDEMTPVAIADIICIIGAQDYAEVSTVKDRHLVRLSLGEFEARLDAAAFVRVHRSAIINLGQLDRTEPAGGGRLLAHMSNGEMIQVSRTGAQALRRFLV